MRVTRFVSIIIIRFDATIAEVEDIVVGVIHVDVFMKTIIWLKSSSDVNEQQWSILQNLETKFYFTSSWPFETF